MIAVMATFATASSQAQDKQKTGEDWKKKMMSEKVAFFTVELDLTPEEAQKFWPVYNEVDKEKDEATAAVFMAYFELEKALKAKKPERKSQIFSTTTSRRWKSRLKSTARPTKSSGKCFRWKRWPDSTQAKRNSGGNTYAVCTEGRTRDEDRVSFQPGYMSGLRRKDRIHG